MDNTDEHNDFEPKRLDTGHYSTLIKLYEIKVDDMCRDLVNMVIEKKTEEAYEYAVRIDETIEVAVMLHNLRLKTHVENKKRTGEING